MAHAYAHPFTRTDRSPTAIWWWTLDRVTLTLALILLVLGFFVFVFLVADAWRHKRRHRKRH